jgi:pimeloyl-ACP methyl ester carboxylesterase
MQEERIRSLEAAIRRDPRDPEPRYDLGSLLLAQHRHQPALTQFEAALRLAPGHPQILLQIGNALSALGKFEAAAQRFREAVQADPRQAAAHYNLGNALRELGQPEAAEASYRAALHALVTFEQRAALPTITVPTLCLAAEHDRTAPPEVMQRMAERIPGGTYACIGGAGHLASVEQPQAFADAVTAFLRQHLGAP